MAIQTNFPAIKPSLNLDFANTKMLDSRVTFTRASTGTYYNGVTTAKAEENLLLRSQDYSATWTVTSLTPVTGKTAPDSTSTATEFTATAANAVLTQGYTAIAGSYTFSVWLRRVTGTGDIQIAADNGTWTTKVITGTWARYDVTQTVAAGSKTAGVRVVTDTDAIEVWGAQLEQRAAMTAYTATTTQPITNYIPVLLTAQSGVPRFDHNPTTDESLGLLIEESRTNLLTYSEQFDNAAWTIDNITKTANTNVAPDGTITADSISETVAAGNHRTNQSIAKAASAITYTASVYAKTNGRNIRVSFDSGSTANSIEAGFNLTSGTISVAATAAGTFTNPSASITSIGNGWYRCTITGTTGTELTVRPNVWLLNGTTQNYTGDGYSGVYIWGAQLEAGAFPTSYIQTVASQVTRAADAASMTGTNFSSWFSNAEGTIYAEAVYATASQTQSLVNINDASANNTVELGYATTNRGRVFVGGSAVATLTGTSTTNAKTTLAYKVNDFAFSENGAASVTDNNGTVPVVSQLNIGRRAVGDNLFTGTIKKISYYPMRLTNTNLQALTS